MMFDKLCIDKILDGEKTVTRRVMRSNKRPAIPGKIHKLKKDRTKKTYGEIKIISCEQDSFLFLTEKEAKLEGFNSKEEYLMYFSKINKIPLDELPYFLIWRVEFEVIK